MAVLVCRIGVADQPAPQLQCPPQVIGAQCILNLLAHYRRPAEPCDQPGCPLSGREREQLGLVSIEKPEQPGADLAQVVLGHPVELRGDEVVVAPVRELHGQAHIGVEEALVGGSHRLVPQELDRVPVAHHPLGDLVASAHGRPVGGHQVLRRQAQQLVDARDQDPGVAVLLTSDGEHVEQHRPHQIVHRQPQLRKPVGDRVVGVRGCRVDLDAQAGQVQGGG